MKTRFLNLSFFSLSLLFLSGCSVLLDGINAVGLTFFADDYVLTHADGTQTKMWNLAKDGSEQNQISERMQPFSVEAHQKVYEHDEQRQFQELTVSNLKEIAKHNQLTLAVQWLPHCGPSRETTIKPLFELASRLKEQNVQLNNGEVALVLASTSYDFLNMDRFFSSTGFSFQPYIIPASPYHEKIIIKEILFNRELLPGLYETEKDDISRYGFFLLNNEGEVIEKVSTSYLDREHFEEDLAKLEEKILELTSKETAQQ